MPCWRIAQCLPAEAASFDLVVLDEASQSDLTALPALLRGKRILVVGDQKQVSPTAAFVSEATIGKLKVRWHVRRGVGRNACSPLPWCLCASLPLAFAPPPPRSPPRQARLFAAPSRHPFIEQLLPGRSIFDLAQTCFADARVALSQHFRCVPQCIALSNELFYHSRLQPRRLPPQSERLLPAIVDVKVARGKKKGKVNVREAEALIEYVVNELAEGSGALARRGATVGIISLMGKEQVRVLRALLLQRVSDAQLARHRIVVGDPSSFQVRAHFKRHLF